MTLLRSTAAISPVRENRQQQRKITLEEVAWEWLAARRDNIKESTLPTTPIIWSGAIYCRCYWGNASLYPTPEVLDEFLRESCAPAGPMAKAAFPQRPWRTFAPSFYRFCSMRSAVNIPAPHRATCFIQKPAVSYQNHDREEQAKLETVLFQCPDPAPGHSNSPVWGLQLGRCAPCNGGYLLESGTSAFIRRFSAFRTSRRMPGGRPRSSLTAPKTEFQPGHPHALLSDGVFKATPHGKDVYLLTGKRAYMEPALPGKIQRSSDPEAGVGFLYRFHRPCVTPFYPLRGKRL